MPDYPISGVEDAKRRVRNSVIDAKIVGAEDMKNLLTLFFKGQADQMFLGEEILPIIEHAFKELQIFRLQKKE